MNVLTCKTMRTAVLISAIVFAAGVLFQIPALTSLFDGKFFEVILAFLGLMGMFISFALATIVAIASLFPKASRRLKLCQH